MFQDTRRRGGAGVKRRLLLIDADEKRAHYVARRLRLRGYESEVATSYLYALTTLEWQQPGLIVTRVDAIDGMTPAEFGSTVKQDPTLRVIPLVLVGRHEARTQAEVGWFDVILEDADPDSLAARLAELANEGSAFAAGDPEPVRSSPDAWAAEGPSEAQSRLEGFLALLETLALGLESGRVVVGSNGHPESVFVLVDHGRMVHAVYRSLEGGPAFRRVLRDLEEEPDTVYRFETMPRWQVGQYPRSIRHHERRLLLEMAARRDEFMTRDLDHLVERD